MKIAHWMKHENSGLVRTATELAHWEQRLGHEVYIAEPASRELLFGENTGQDIHVVHSQLHHKYWHDPYPKVMIMHGEPLSSVANGISMRAIVDLLPICNAFICMRTDEYDIWKSLNPNTFLIDKGVDLERFRPIRGQESPEKLEGDPAVVYCENWRGERNPLYLCVAMKFVQQVLPKAQLHLFNCQSKPMFDTFKALWSGCKWMNFMRALNGPVSDVNELYNRADIVVSCLNPLYARGVEAFGANKPFICPGYKEHEYPYQCDLNPESIANAIIDCYRNGYNIPDPNEDKVLTPRAWAGRYHDAKKSTEQAITIYEKFL